MEPISPDASSAEALILAALVRTKPSAGRTLLLSGPWGCGKTFLWKQIEQSGAIGRSTITVSAFGASSENLKAWVMDPIESRASQEDSPVICIDDIERTSPDLKMEALLGFINALSEQRGLDVVLICNEDKIKQDQLKAYQEYREKVVSYEVHLQVDPGTMFDRVSDAAATTAAGKQRILDAKPIIVEVFERSKTSNLRVLSRISSRLELLARLGIRQFSDDELRFFAAVSIFCSTGIPFPEDFFEFNPFALRVSANLDVRNRKEDPVQKARLEFLDLYFGDAEYSNSAPILNFVRKGTVRPADFATHSAPEPTPVQRALAPTRAGDWTYAGDGEVRRIIADLCSVIKNDSATARELLEALAFARYMANIIQEELVPGLGEVAKAALLVRGNAGDGSLGVHWTTHMTELMHLIKEEYECFEAARAQGTAKRLAATYRTLLESEDISGLLNAINNGQLTPVQVFLAEIGLDSMLDLHKSKWRLFNAVVAMVFEKTERFAVVWPEAAAYRDELARRLEMIVADSTEERMVRWRVESLLRAKRR